MVKTKPFEKEEFIGAGTARLLCEAHIDIKPPMSKIIGELFNAEIKDCLVFNDKVIVKGVVEKTFYYRHPHLDKKDEHDKKERSDKIWEEDHDQSGKDTCEEEDGRDSMYEQLKKIQCSDNCCKQVGSCGGIVHFHQQFFKFVCTVDLPGVKPGDICKIKEAKVKDYASFVVTEKGKHDLITKGKQMFIVDIFLKATRHKKKFPKQAGTVHALLPW